MKINTLHEALDAFGRSVETCCGGRLEPYVQNRLRIVARLKEHSADVPLTSLAIDKCSSLVEYWRNRPMSRTGKPFALASARKYVSELHRFFHWMDANEECEWRLPRAFDQISRSIKRLDSDRASHLRHQSAFTVRELSLLNQYADEADRLMLYLGLNCGIAAAGLVTLRITDFLFDHEHEAVERTELSSDERHSFLRFVRPSTDQFFEWILWPETAAVVRQAVDRSRSLDIETLFVTKDGRPLTGDTARDPGAVLSRRFRRLVVRVREDQPEFASLPLGSLRRCMSDRIRCKANAEIASLYLGHSGMPDVDSWMHPPFGQLHWTLMEIRRELKPVFGEPS